MTEATIDRHFTKITISSENSLMNTEYPVLQIYIDDVLKYTMVVGGSATIGSTTYTTTSLADDLNYTSTTTTLGTRYIQEITNNILGLDAIDTPLEDGVWVLKFLDLDEEVNLFEGIVVHDQVDYCIAKKIDKALNDKCCEEKVLLKDVMKAWTFLQSAKDSARLEEFTNAIRKFEIVQAICSEDCDEC